MAAAPPALIKGAGEPVVLVHAFPLDGRMWASQTATLQERYQVIVPDVLGLGAGAGRVPAGAGAGALDQVADGIAALLDDAGIERAVVGGCSMGGYVAFAFLRRHPGRLRGLILIDTRATPDTQAAARARLVQAERVLAEGVGPLPEEMLPNLLGKSSRATRPEVVETVTRLILEQDPRAVAAALRAMAARPDSSDLLPSITVPTLVVTGAEDTLIPPANSREMARAIPRARFVEINHAGHLPALEAPDELDAVLAKFMSELGQTTP